jgi:hypothetical protein
MKSASFSVFASAVLAGIVVVPARAGASSTCAAQERSCYAKAKADIDEGCRPLCDAPGVNRKSCEKGCTKSYGKERLQCRNDMQTCRRGALRVTFQGAASYQMTLVDDGPVEQVQGGVRWTTVFDEVVVNPLKGLHVKVPGDLPTSWMANPNSSFSDGSFDVQVFGSTPCHGSGGLHRDPSFPPILSVTLHSDGSADFTVQAVSTVVEYPLGADDCSDIGGTETSDFWQDWVTGFAHAGLDSNSTLTYAFTLSKEQLAQGKVIVIAQAPPDEVPPTDCGSGDGAVCTQSYGWTGTVTLQRESTLSPAG